MSGRSGPLRPAYRYAAKLIRVLDGDTYELDIDTGFRGHEHQPIRIIGWSCDENRQVNGPAAKAEATRLLSSATSIVVETKKDDPTFERWLGHVFVDGVNIGVLLAAKGLAVKDSRRGRGVNHCPMCSKELRGVEHAECIVKMWRELEAANARIKRLQEA